MTKKINPRQKRLLAIDGGGILGVISIQVLMEMERQIHRAFGEKTRLCDYFDYVAGTSTGAIIAAAIAMGRSAVELDEFYREHGKGIFTRARFYNRYRHKYNHKNLARIAKREFTTKSLMELQDEGLLSTRKHLLIVTRNVNTDSPWPLSTNPGALYNHRDRADCNLKTPLWQLVRASTAAPTFFAPERINLEPGNRKKSFFFEDGGVTPFNNPSVILYRKATQPEYNCNWATGEDRMMMVSLGTGTGYRRMSDLDPAGEGLLETAKSIPAELMRGMSVENDTTCRTIGRCVYGKPLDREIGTMIPHRNKKTDRAFLYARFDPDISAEAFAELSLDDIDPADVSMDNVRRMKDFIRIGKAEAQNVDLARQFPTFM